MKTKLTNSKRLDILGNSDSDRDVLTSLLKQWRQKLGYCSVFAAIPALLSSQITGARSQETIKTEVNVPGRGAGFFKSLNRGCSNPALLKRQSEFRLPHQNGNFAALVALAGNDDCPGSRIPGGSYTAAVPYSDSGDTTGANNTINRIQYYYYYNVDALGPDHVYSFTLTGRGPNPQIQVSTTSASYSPLIYVLYGGYAGACPAGTGTVSDSLAHSPSAAPGVTVALNSQQMNFLPLNVPLHLFVDSRVSGPNGGAGAYTLRMQDVTISPSVCSNPIDCPEYFLYQHYLDFLGREPDPPGIAAWLALLNSCASGDTSCDRIHVSSAFFQSPEFLGRGYFIYRLYPVSFGRKPDYIEFREDFWRVSGFLTDEQLENIKVAFLGDFMRRPAFEAKFGGLSNTQYVDTLLSTAGITHPARNFWIEALGNTSRTRLQVLREIAESAEVYQKYYNQAFVMMQYFGYLRRQPDALYLNWIAHLEATNDYRSMINGFINSTEYRARFGP